MMGIPATAAALSAGQAFAASASAPSTETVPAQVKSHRIAFNHPVVATGSMPVGDAGHAGVALEGGDRVGRGPEEGKEVVAGNDRQPEAQARRLEDLAAGVRALPRGAAGADVGVEAAGVDVAAGGVVAGAAGTWRKNSTTFV